MKLSRKSRNFSIHGFGPGSLAYFNKDVHKIGRRASRVRARTGLVQSGISGFLPPAVNAPFSVMTRAACALRRTLGAPLGRDTGSARYDSRQEGRFRRLISPDILVEIGQRRLAETVNGETSAIPR